jgi:hypothetical protein
MDREFRTKRLADHDDMRHAHRMFYRERANGTRGPRAPGWNYYVIVGTYLSRHRDDLRLRPEGSSEHDDGQLWVRLDI